jgi:Uncharacterised nucleotidyltransferase
MSRDAMLLVNALRDPATTGELDAEGWTALIAMARAEQLIGTLAHRLKLESVPPKMAEILADAQINAEYQRRSALWEAECAARALVDYAGKVVLMKGTAYVAAGLSAGEGRHIGDLDIMVARDDLPQVEALLLEKGGWEWVKEDAYDDAYYRDHMHELPPLIHKDRDRMIDVHHTILPLTAGPRPDAEAMLREAIYLPSRLRVEGPVPRTGPRGSTGPGEGLSKLPNVSDPSLTPPANGRGTIAALSPHDMIIHCAAHLIADGDLAGGLRNLWDMHCLVSEFEGDDERYFLNLTEDAWYHQLGPEVSRAVRLAHALYGTELKHFNHPSRTDFRPRFSDVFFIRRLTARDGWGRTTRRFTRLAFYIRSHWLRMPPLMLARHLWTKWLKQKR